MTTSSASAILLMSHYGMQCEIQTGRVRVLDVLNDQSSHYMQVEDAKIFRRDSMESRIKVPRALVVKDNIHMVVPVGESHKDDSKLFFATLERRTYSVSVMLPSGLVEGCLHVKSAKDPQSFLAVEAAPFVPVTKATVYDLASSAQRLESPVVLIKKATISSLTFHSDKPA